MQTISPDMGRTQPTTDKNDSNGHATLIAIHDECPYHIGKSFFECPCGDDGDDYDDMLASGRMAQYDASNDAPKRQKIPRGRKDWR